MQKSGRIRFEFIASTGADWGVVNLQRVLPAPISMHIDYSSDGLVVSWLGEGFRLQGAEQVTGPWFELGVISPVVVSPTYPARFFRLISE